VASEPPDDSPAELGAPSQSAAAAGHRTGRYAGEGDEEYRRRTAAAERKLGKLRLGVWARLEGVLRVVAPRVHKPQDWTGSCRHLGSILKPSTPHQDADAGLRLENHKRMWQAPVDCRRYSGVVDQLEEEVGCRLDTAAPEVLWSE
jgi:hypothetical protein